MTKPRRTVLVIDGTAQNCDRYQHQLQQDVIFSYQLITDGTWATLAQLPDQPIDAILLDLEVLHPHELKLLDHLQAALEERWPPLVVVGCGDPQTIVQTFRHGAADYLVKDQMTGEDLCRALRTAIEKAELIQKLHYSRQRFQTSVECLMDCFGIFTAMRDRTGQIVDFRIDYLNQAAAENNQMPRDEQIGRGLCDLLPGHRQSGLFEAYCQVVETGAPLVKDSVIYEDTYGGRQRVVRAFDIRATRLDDGFVASWRDITDRKGLELEMSQTITDLQQEQGRLQRLIDNAPIGIAIGTSSGEVKVMNDAMLAIYGYNRDKFEQQGLNWWNFIPPEGVESAEQALTQLHQQGHLPPHEKELVQLDGSRIPVWFSAAQWVYSSDEHVAFAVDLTPQKQAEAALRASQQRYRELAEAMPPMVWTAEGENGVNYWNQRWYEYTGYDEAASMGLEGVEVVHPDDRDRTLTQWHQAMTTGTSFEIEYRLRRFDGQYRWFICRGLPTLSAQGEVQGWIGTLTDIEQIKQSEVAFKQITIALRESEKLLRLALQGAQAGTWVWDMATEQLTWSPETYQLFGRDPALGSPSYSDCRRIIHPDDRERVDNDIINVLEQRFSTFRSEFRILHSVHGLRWLLGLGRLTFDDQGIPVQFSGINLDITAQKTAEADREELLQREQAARAEAERVNRIKDDFLAILSHELRSPLNPILGWSRLLQMGHLDEAKTAQALITIERNAKLQAQLIDDLLDVARILRGKLQLTTAPVNLRFVIQSALETVETAAKAKAIELQVDLGEPAAGEATSPTDSRSQWPQIPPCQVLGDQARLQQILWNLLSNAIKFTPKSGQVRVRLESDNHQAHITVQDTGKGIDPSFIPYLFESFRQEDVSITRQYGGLGLGLAIVRYLVEAHGGTIVATSPGEGLGATFTVSLPLLAVETAAPPPADPAFTADRPDLSGIRIMTVDDDPDTRELLTSILTFYGADVLTVSSGAEALANWEALQPDILLSDLGMPDLDGYDLIERIRTLPCPPHRQVPAIAISAYTHENDQKRALASGFQQHMAKPLEIDHLVKTVVRLVRQPPQSYP